MKTFKNIKEVSGDPAYASRKHASLISSYGAVPYLKPRKTDTSKARGSLPWKKMVILFRENFNLFQKSYGLRNNAESAFSAIKLTVGKNVKSKSEQGQINEIFVKCICHQFKVLVHGIFGLGIEVSDWLKD